MPVGQPFIGICPPGPHICCRAIGLLQPQPAWPPRWPNIDIIICIICIIMPIIGSIISIFMPPPGIIEFMGLKQMAMETTSIMDVDSSVSRKAWHM